MYVLVLHDGWTVNAVYTYMHGLNHSPMQATSHILMNHYKLHTYQSMHIHTSTHTYCTCPYTHMYPHILYICTYTRLPTHTVHVHMHTCTHTYVLYKCTYTHLPTHTVHTYSHLCRWTIFSHRSYVPTYCTYPNFYDPSCCPECVPYLAFWVDKICLK